MQLDAYVETQRKAPCDRCGIFLPVNQLRCEQTFLFCRDNEGCDIRVKAREEAEFARGRKIALQFEEAAGDNQGGLGSSLLDLFCDCRESTLLGQITAALIESGYHGARLYTAVEGLRSSQYFRDLIQEYRAHIARVGAE